MALITMIRNLPAYCVTRGAINTTTSTSMLFFFANTLLNANNIVRTSASRLTFEEGGLFEVLIPFEVNCPPATPATLHYGINGTWTPIGTFTPGSNPGVYGHFNLVIDIPNNGYLEFKATSAANITSTLIGTGQGNVVSVTPNVVIRKI